MKNKTFYFLLILLISCNSEDNISCSNKYLNPSSSVKLTKLTVKFKNMYTESNTVFTINSNNQITNETFTSYSRDFIYNGCNQLIKRNKTYFNDPDRITEDYTEYDVNGHFTKHRRGNYRVSVIDNTNPDEIEVRATLAGNDQYSTNGIWKFNSKDKLVSDGNFEYKFEENNLIHQNNKNSNNKSTAEYYDIINPISIVKINTFGKRNIFFYASDKVNTSYFFDDIVLDNSINLPKKILSIDRTIDGSVSEMNVVILETKDNIATHFITEYKDNPSSIFPTFSYEYLIEIE